MPVRGTGTTYSVIKRNDICSFIRGWKTLAVAPYTSKTGVLPYLIFLLSHAYQYGIRKSRLSICLITNYQLPMVKSRVPSMRPFTEFILRHRRIQGFDSGQACSWPRDRQPARLVGYPRKLNGRLKPSSTICSRNHPSTFSGQVRFPSRCEGSQIQIANYQIIM